MAVLRASLIMNEHLRHAAPTAAAALDRPASVFSADWPHTSAMMPPDRHMPCHASHAAPPSFTHHSLMPPLTIAAAAIMHPQCGRTRS